MENAGSDRRSSIPVADGKGIRIAVQACMGSGQGYCDSSAGCRIALRRRYDAAGALRSATADSGAAERGRLSSRDSCNCSKWIKKTTCQSWWLAHCLKYDILNSKKLRQGEYKSGKGETDHEYRKTGAAADHGAAGIPKLLVKPKVLVIAAVVILVAIAAVAVLLQTSGREEPQPQVFNKSTLERIINVSELSTFTAVYNGIARVANEKKPEKIDYYVSYEATVNAGIDFQKVEISMDEEQKTITLKVPEAHITNQSVEMSSLDFIFLNQKADKSGVTEAAYKACEEDVRQESEQQTAICELAKQNAENVLC